MKLKKWRIIIPVFLTISACNKVDLSSSQQTFKAAPINPNKELLINLVNEIRSKGCNCGSTYYPPCSLVVWNDTLENVAKKHCVDMNSNNYFDHTAKDGTTPGDRLLNSGYQFSYCSENIAKGIPTETEVIQAWLKSPLHCKNLMNTKAKDMGIATCGLYWTQVFATPK